MLVAAHRRPAGSAPGVVRAAASEAASAGQCFCRAWYLTYELKVCGGWSSIKTCGGMCIFQPTCWRVTPQTLPHNLQQKEKEQPKQRAPRKTNDRLQAS